MTGAGKYTGEMAAHWAQGHEVLVVTSPPYYPQWKIGEPYKNSAYVRETQGRLTVLRCPLWVSPNLNFPKRILHLSSFVLSSFWPLLWSFWSFKPNLIFCVTPTFLCLPSATLLSRIFRRPLWVHVQDFELDAMLGLKAQSRRRLARGVLSLEAWLLRRAQYFSSISPEMCGKLAIKIQQKSPVQLLPNWVDCELFKPADARDIKAKWGYEEGDFIVLYSGNIGLKQGLDQLPSVARATSHVPKIKYLVIGAGVYLSELQRQVQEQQLQNIRFAPLQRAEDLPGILNMAQVHLVLQKAEVSDLVLPSKLTAILAVGGLAILTAPEGSHLHRLVEEHPGIAICLPPSKPLAIGQCLLELEQNRPQLPNVVARSYAEQHLGKEKILSSLDDVLDSLHDP